MNKQIAQIIEKLQLLPHPEGGFYKEIYRSNEVIPKKTLGHEYSGDRNSCTSIYFLLTSETFSAFHKILQDEIWHFYSGSSITLHTITTEGNHTTIQVGNDFTKNEQPQAIIKGGDWFGASVLEPNSYALVGCTVSPGFDFNDFTLANRPELLQQFPQHKEIITALTRI